MLRSATAWIRSITSVRGRVAEQVRVAALQLQVLLDRHRRRIFETPTTSPSLCLEDREQPGLLGQPRDPDRVARGASPSRAGRARRCGCSGRRGTPSPARPCTRGRAARRRSPWPRRGSRAPSRSAARSCPGRRRCRAASPTRLRVRGPRRGRRRARALHAGVHVGLVVVADEEHVVVSLEHPRQAGEADVHGAAVAPLADHPHVGRGPSTFSAAAMPVATAGALPNSEWIQGSCQEDSGNGVEKTSRQPVALAAIILPSGGPHRRVERVARARAPRRIPGRRGGRR